jgi:Tfp pilus assembly protein PilF
MCLTMFLPTDPLFKTGIQKLNAKDYIGALADFDQIIESNPSHWGYRAYTFRSMVRQALGDEKGAIEDMAIFSEMIYKYSIQLNHGNLDTGFQPISNLLLFLV